MGESSRSTISSVILRASLATLLLAVLAACSTPAGTSPTPQAPNAGSTDVQDAVAPEGFGYETTSTYSLSVSSEDLFADPIANAIVKIYHSYDLANNDLGQEAIVALTDDQGKLNTELSLASHIESVLVVIDAFGIPNMIELSVASNMTAHFGPETISAEAVSSDFSSQAFTTLAADYLTLGSWSDKKGVPDYLEPYEKPQKRLIQLAQKSFPAGKSVAKYHPHYLLSDVKTDLFLQEDSEVSISFVHESAGYRNSLLYYTYDPANPPQSVSDIDDLTVVFPNSSYGTLKSGDRVQLKYGNSTTFPKGTAVGWAVIADGWQMSKNKGLLTDGKDTYYSIDQLNSDKSQHMVAIYDAITDTFLLGTEDLNRLHPGTDNDFNDTIFQITLSNSSAVDSDDYVQGEDNPPKDSDEDGVKDTDDHYPNDPNKAFNTYYPSADGYNTLAYEDRWPLEGDYDFNDLVVGYRINQIVNAKNQVVEIKAEFKFRATGAAFTNAFAFELPLPADSVASVEGSHFVDPNGSYNYIQRNANGTEAGQDNAVIFVSDDVSKLLGYLVNTEKSGAKAEAKTVELTITFNSPQEQNKLLPPYNPFIVTNVDGLVIAATGEERATRRGHEIHLPNHAPTKLADMSLFNTLDDASAAAKGQWYVTKGNQLPWALHIPGSFDYPIENVEISEGYNHFVEWVNSGGQKHTDWYSDQAGYRNTSSIY